jgi:hypothetical protein
MFKSSGLIQGSAPMVFMEKYVMEHLRIWLAFIMAAGLLVSGCAATSKRQLPIEAPLFAMLPNGGNPLNPAEQSAVNKETALALAERIKRRGGQRLKGLQLSGGGQNGAFGAGFLKGWSESGNRPEFDYVTGVSTGAILSTFAFLGTEKDDAMLAETWLNLTRDDIFHKEGSLFRLAFGGDSLYDTEPLRELIAKLITPEVIKRVAAEYAKGRRLLVSTTNLDSDQTWVWDLTAVAKHGGKDALTIFRKAVVASASPPILFSPVEINGSLLVDGGARHNLLILGLYPNAKEIARLQGGKSDHPRLSADVYIIMHHKPHRKIEPIIKNIKHILKRSVNTMIDTSTADSLVRSYFIAQLHGMKFNLVQIPEDVENGDDRLAFDPAIMKALYEAGRELGRKPDPWQHEPPPTDEIAPWILKDTAQRLNPEKK